MAAFVFLGRMTSHTLSCQNGLKCLQIACVILVSLLCLRQNTGTKLTRHYAECVLAQLASGPFSKELPKVTTSPLAQHICFCIWANEPERHMIILIIYDNDVKLLKCWEMKQAELLQIIMERWLWHNCECQNNPASLFLAISCDDLTFQTRITQTLLFIHNFSKCIMRFCCQSPSNSVLVT